MSRLFPARSEATIERDDDPSVLYVDQEETDQVISVLSSDTARRIFRTLNQRALSASEIADEMDISVQNATYHLGNLEDADLVEVIDTCYSEKGREMEIYAVTRDPKLLVLGLREDRATLRQAFRQLAESVGLPALGIAAVGSVSRMAERVLEA